MFRKTMEEYEADTRKKLVIDIREKEAFDKETMPGALHMDSETLKQQIKELTKDQTPVYLLCHTGQQSDALAEDFEKEGYEVYSIQDGFRAYLRLKLRTVMRQEDLKEQCCADVERSIVKKFRKEIWRPFTKAINEYELIKDGDKIAVCISGGKDSMLMAKLFQELKTHNKFPFELVFLVMDPGYSVENRDVIESNARRLNIPITVFETDIFNSVYNVDKYPCYLCARMRRGYLYKKAKQLGCNKIALGHHYDDVIETILMGMLYGGQVQTMMPKLHSTNYEGMELIRPLYLVREAEIKHWRDYNKLNFIQCACRFTDTCTTCSPNSNTGSKRQEIKQLIANLKKINPQIESNIFHSVENVNLDTIISYKQGDNKVSFLDRYDDMGKGK